MRNEEARASSETKRRNREGDDSSKSNQRAGREASRAFKGAAEGWCVIQMLSRQKRSISVSLPFYEMEMRPERWKTWGGKISFDIRCNVKEWSFVFSALIDFISTYQYSEED